MKVKICRKEAKESRYWLRLIDPGDDAALKKHLGELVQEATELMNIFGAILRKSEYESTKSEISKSETNSKR